MPCSGPRAPRRALGVNRLGGFACARVQCHHRVQRWSSLIVRVDPRKIEVYELPRRDHPLLHRALKFLDRLLHDVERRELSWCGLLRSPAAAGGG